MLFTDLWAKIENRRETDRVDSFLTARGKISPNHNNLGPLKVVTTYAILSLITAILTNLVT